MSARPLMLSLETATLAGSISISRGSSVLSSCGGNPTVSHSNTLLRDIDDLLSQVSLTIRDIELFAVASGPGSFTGLRIGIATVKALAATLLRPCVGVPTLAAIAHSAGLSPATVSLLPAGRGEVFVQMFSCREEDVVVELDQPEHLSPARAIEKYMDRDTICWAGNGSQLHSNLIREAAAKMGNRFVEENDKDSVAGQKGWSIATRAVNLAEHVASLAVIRFSQDRDQTGNGLRAIYVRPSDAEIKV
jgi:tRNA threonylcarbamoyladenosine biosynthesis protein TsaB